MTIELPRGVNIRRFFRCATCNRLVQRIARMEVAGRAWLFEVECHGKRESVRVTRSMFEDVQSVAVFAAAPAAPVAPYRPRGKRPPRFAKYG